MAAILSRPQCAKSQFSSLGLWFWHVALQPRKWHRNLDFGSVVMTFGSLWFHNYDLKLKSL